jgi:hypothetical protein
MINNKSIRALAALAGFLSCSSAKADYASEVLMDAPLVFNGPFSVACWAKPADV